MWLRLGFYIFVKIALVSTEVITLIKQNNITCILNGDSLHSPVYITSPNDYVNINRTVHEIGKKIDDWNIMNSDKMPQMPILDQRWMDFSYHPRNGLNLNKADLSVCFNKSLNVTISNSEHDKSIPVVLNNTKSSGIRFCEWNHYFLVNKTLMQYFNGSYENITTPDFEPKFITFSDEFHNKSHKYEFLYSETVSHQKSSIDVNSSKCISMFVSVDKNSNLSIALESGNQVLAEEKVEGFNELHSPKEWKRVQVQTESNYSNLRLTFNRTRQGNNSTGYWAIDEIQNCKSDLDIYATTLKNTNASSHICEILSPKMEVSKMACNHSYIGKFCNISCERILGQPYSFCQEHKICLGDQCHCAWGYKGSNCLEVCGQGQYGMDCEEKCNKGCGICDATTGCTKCKNKYFGPQCSNEFPVVKLAPILESIINDNTIQILIQFEHGEDETVPEYYVIQYKKLNNSTYDFKNYSEVSSYPGTSNTRTKLQMNLPRNDSYEIRIILLCKNGFFDENVPVLTVHAKSLRSNFTKSGITLYWNKTHTLPNDEYVVEYECANQFCSNNATSKNITVQGNTVNITDIKPFKTCFIKLFTSKDQLIDTTTVESPNSTSKITDQELPKNATFVKNTLYIELGECEKFTGPLTYNFEYHCISDWCKNESTRTQIEQLIKHKANITIGLAELKPFTTYTLSIVAERSEQETKKKAFGNFTTEPSKHKGVQDLSVYCKFDDKLRIRWKEPYPPTGEVEIYNITLTESESGIIIGNTNSVLPCVLWDDFICANISEVNNGTNYFVNVYAKNYNVSDWSEPRNAATENLPKESSVPENKRITLSPKPNEIIISWEHPLYTYGNLEKFHIKIESDTKTVKMVENVKKGKRSYQRMIAVEYGAKYNISIWGRGQFDGQKTTMKAIIFEPKTKSAAVGWCSKTCYLLIQHPKQTTNFKVNITPNENATLQERGRASNNFGIHEAECRRDEQLHRSVCKIEENIFEDLQNQQSCIKIADENEPMCCELAPKEDNAITEGSVAIIVGAIVAVISVILILGLIFYIYRRKKKSGQKYENKEIKLSELREKDKLLEEELVTNNNERFFSPKPIEIDYLEKYLLKSLEENADSNEITRQFEMIPKSGSKTCVNGRLPENIDKNRYRNVVAYDDTRVILKDNDNNDYINANYIDGFEAPKAFIAAQAPLASTVHDFWFMICQENVQTIIMLTELKENGRVKSAKYWPENQDRFRFGPFLIENISTNVTPNYIYQMLQVRFKNETRMVEHYQYVTWPDHDVPLCLQSFTTFIKEIIGKQQTSPVVVHCNAGCGRTGTFILCDIALRMGVKTKQVDFFNILKQIRDQRPSMVSHLDQYIFAHFAVWQYFFGQDFSIPVTDDFDSDVQKALNETNLQSLINRLEKDELLHLYYQKAQFKLNNLLTDEEKSKNRFSTILPGRSQIFLPVSSQETSNYINAISVDSHRNPGRFIVSQQPLPNTIKDFWKLVKEYEINTIVSLNELDDGDPQCPRFWPNDIQRLWEIDNVCTLRFFSQDNNNDEYRIVRIQIDTGDEDLKKKIVNIIEMKNWRKKTLEPPHISDLILVCKKIMQSTGQIVVTCYDGATASGLFVALAFLLDKINMDHICDVFTAVSYVRQSRSEFVKDPEQLRFLYVAALEYIQAFSTYENFK